MLEQLELSLKILLLGSINSVFSLQCALNVHVAIVRWKYIDTSLQTVIFFTHSPLIDLSLSIKDFVDFLEEHLSTFAFSPQKQPSSSELL